MHGLVLCSMFVMPRDYLSFYKEAFLAGTLDRLDRVKVAYF